THKLLYLMARPRGSYGLRRPGPREVGVGARTSSGPTRRIQERLTEYVRLLGGDPTGGPKVVDVLEAQVHGGSLGREVRMTGDPRHIGREPIEIGRVVHWEGPHPRRQSARGLYDH